MPGEQAMFGWEFVYTKFYGVPNSDKQIFMQVSLSKLIVESSARLNLLRHIAKCMIQRLTQFSQTSLKHLRFLRESAEQTHIYFTNLPQSDMLHRINRRISLRNNGRKQRLTGCSFKGIIGQKALLEIHHRIQGNPPVGIIVNQESLVFLMAVGVADQIIKDVHSVKGDGIKLLADLNRIKIVIGGIDIERRL